MRHAQKPGRRLSAGSWAAILYAGGIFMLSILLQVGVWTLPTDGWNMGPGGDDPAHFYGELQANVAGLSSELRPGDRVIAVEGIPISGYMARGYRFWRFSPPSWQDGQTLRYSVLRDGSALDIDVPIRVIGAAGHILGSMKIAVGVINPIAALLEVIASLAFAFVSVVVFILRPRERASQALLVIGLPFFFQHGYIITGLPLLGYPVFAFGFLFISTWLLAILPAFFYLTLVFPRPKWIVRRFPHLTAVVIFGLPWLLQGAPFLLYPADTTKALMLQRDLGWAGMLYLVLPLFMIGHSLLTERQPVARAQLKWVVLGVVGFVTGGLAFGVGGQSGWTLLVSLIQNGGYLMLPVCIGIAIIRHRLFDIDLIIRRTLVYAIVTAVLAGVFYGAVLVFQRFFTTVSGQTSPVAIVASTLAIAALFSPLRRRVQDFVDRRFYRRRYNSERVLARFGRVARDETNLDSVSDALTLALEETMQPANVGVWLRTAEPQ